MLIPRLGLDRITGGAMYFGMNLYVGAKPRLPPHFDRFATRNESFRIGRRLGFVAGINKGTEQEQVRGQRRAGVVNEIRQRTHRQEMAEIERRGYITKQEILANHQAIYAKLLTAIARKFGMPRYQSATKDQLVNYLTNYDWQRVNLRDLL